MNGKNEGEKIFCDLINKSLEMYNIVWAMYFFVLSCAFTESENEREKSNFVATITKFCDKNHNENYFGNKFNCWNTNYYTH